MLKTLVRKQFLEVFRSYFYDAKKNKMRSKGAIFAWFLFFFLVMAGLIGGMFGGMAFAISGPLAAAGLDWMYFALMGVLAILFGTFGSVFSTYSELYLAKDNELLLSMPVPVRTLLASRLIMVYLLGTFYSACVLVPALVIYLITAGVTFARILCGLILFMTVSLTVLTLSCALGWVVARISLKLKNRSMITVLISLVCFGAYYFVCFRATNILQGFLANFQTYGEKIKGSAYVLYLFGQGGTGDMLSAAAFLCANVLIFALAYRILDRSFISIATAGAGTVRKRYIEKNVPQRSVPAALLKKEFRRFLASPNYMLNCGLGTLLIPLCGVLLLMKGGEIYGVLTSLLASVPGAPAVLLCGALCMLSVMNDMAAPSLSLEGKSLWMLQSLPIRPQTVLRAKMALQLLLTSIPMLFASVLGAVGLKASPVIRLLTVLTPLAFTLFSAAACTALGVKKPMLNWVTETAPVKRGAPVTIALLGGWALGILMIVLYLTIAYPLGAIPYMTIWSLLLLIASFLLIRWLDTKGSEIFSALN